MAPSSQSLEPPQKPGRFIQVSDTVQKQVASNGLTWSIGRAMTGSSTYACPLAEKLADAH